MKNDALLAELRARTDAFVSELTTLIVQHMTQALASAIDGAATFKAPNGVNGKRSKNRAPINPVTNLPRSGWGSSLDPATVLKELKRRGDRSVEELARSLSTTTKSLRLPLRKLRQQKLVKKRGQRRGMRYTAT
jgi:hypothetical protein